MTTSEKERKKIIELYKRELSISEIARRVERSRPTVRKIINENKEETKFSVKSFDASFDYVYLLVNTSMNYPARGKTVIQALSDGVGKWYVKKILGKIIQDKTAKKLINEIEIRENKVSLFKIKQSEFKPDYQKVKIS